MDVFTTDWIEQAQNAIAMMPKYKPIPFQYILATATQLTDLRELIEHWVADFPTETRKQLISRLRSRNADHTLNELRFGNHLKQLGCEIEYEPKLSGLTPDWLVKTAATSFIVEVFTASHASDEEAELEKSIRANIIDLVGRLQEIIVPYGITVHISPTPAILTESINEQLAKNVASWLTTVPPQVGAEQLWLGAHFQVVRYNPAYTSLQIIGPGHSWVVNNEPLQSKIVKKILRYSDVLGQLNMPLILAVAPTMYSGLSIDNLEDIVLGQERVSYHVDAQGAIMGQTYLTRAWKDGLFLHEPHLSGVLWMESRSNISFIQNPNAALPFNLLDIEAV